MALNAELRFKLTARQTAPHDFGSRAASIAIEKAFPFAHGTLANQADLLWSDERTLAASASEDLDLAGELADAFGATISAVELVAIYVEASAANVNDVVIGDATQPVPLFGGTNPTLSVKPGGAFMLVAPGATGQATIGAGSTDDLKIANGGSGTSVTYKIAVLARSA